MMPLPLHKQEKVESVEYDIRLDFPVRVPPVEIFDEIRSGYKDGYGQRFDFPKKVTKAVIIYIEVPFGNGDTSYALARYVYS